MPEQQQQTVVIMDGKQQGFTCGKLIFHSFMLVITGGLWGFWLFFKWLGSQ